MRKPIVSFVDPERFAPAPERQRRMRHDALKQRLVGMVRRDHYVRQLSAVTSARHMTEGFDFRKLEELLRSGGLSADDCRALAEQLSEDCVRSMNHLAIPTPTAESIGQEFLAAVNSLPARKDLNPVKLITLKSHDESFEVSNGQELLGKSVLLFMAWRDSGLSMFQAGRELRRLRPHSIKGFVIVNLTAKPLDPRFEVDAFYNQKSQTYSPTDCPICRQRAVSERQRSKEKG